MIRLLSVPHTGTRFMVELLQAAGLTRTHEFWGNGDFIQVHFDGKQNHPLIYRENGLVIIPLRRRDRVEESWRRRERNPNELASMWTEMEDFSKSYPGHIFYVHIDDETRRDREIQELSEQLNLYLIPDWENRVGQGK